jgi:hypothetical protein
MLKELLPRKLDLENENVRNALLTPKHYKKLRKTIGTQDYVCVLLGVKKITLSRRETGKTPLKLDHIYALEYLIAHYELQVK